MSAKRRRPQMYQAEVNGKKVRVTVPEHQDQAALMRDAIRDQLSPHAVAAIASRLQINRTNNPDVDRQVRWFHGQLCELLGGFQQQSRLAEELGL